MKQFYPKRHISNQLHSPLHLWSTLHCSNQWHSLLHHWSTFHCISTGVEQGSALDTKWILNRAHSLYWWWFCCDRPLRHPSMKWRLGKLLHYCDYITLLIYILKDLIKHMFKQNITIQRCTLTVYEGLDFLLVRMDVSADNGDQTLLDNTWVLQPIEKERVTCERNENSGFDGISRVIFSFFFVCENVQPFKDLI